VSFLRETTDNQEKIYFQLPRKERLKTKEGQRGTGEEKESQGFASCFDF
jgi:hypothetical protein